MLVAARSAVRAGACAVGPGVGSVFGGVPISPAVGIPVALGVIHLGGG